MLLCTGCSSINGNPGARTSDGWLGGLFQTCWDGQGTAVGGAWGRRVCSIWEEKKGKVNIFSFSLLFISFPRRVPPSPDFLRPPLVIVGKKNVKKKEEERKKQRKTSERL